MAINREALKILAESNWAMGTTQIVNALWPRQPTEQDPRNWYDSKSAMPDDVKRAWDLLFNNLCCLDHKAMPFVLAPLMYRWKQTFCGFMVAMSDEDIEEMKAEWIKEATPT